MERRSFVVAACLSTLLLIPLSSGAAEASGWNWGTGFRLGNLHFQIGHSSHHRGGPYFRVGHHIRSRHNCSDYCFVDRSNYYHHESCPVVRGYVRDHGYRYFDLVNQYGPYERGYRNDRRREVRRDSHWDGRYGRYDDRNRRRRYYDSSPRRHRHNRSCPDWHFRRY